ncbi:MAG: diguanylate cyclase [Candidatus Atribacteria bacterium]|nr:diguanylate cyclase [Candidatus Atribacteria bacterium]
MASGILLNIPLKYWQDFQDAIAKVSNANIYIFDTNGNIFSNFSQDIEVCQKINKGKTVRDESCTGFYQSVFEAAKNKGKIFTCPHGCRLYICSLGSYTQKLGYLTINFLDSGDQIGNAESHVVQRASRIYHTVNEVLKSIIEKTVLGLQRLELNSIYEISNLLTSTMELNKVVELITNSLIILYNADMVILGLSEGDKVRLEQATGEQRNLVIGNEWSIDSPLVGEVFAKGEPLILGIERAKSLQGINNLKVDPSSKFVVYPLYSFLGAVGLLVIIFSPNSTTIDVNSRSFQIYANFAAIALANARLVNQLEREAQTDFLTGAYNKRVLLGILSQELEKARKYITPLSVVFLDVDDFKSYNDTYGHLFGDIVLKKIAEIIKRSIRHADFIGRYGGEEFMVILPGTGKEDATMVAEKIRKAIEFDTFPYRNITVSLGVASAYIDDSTNSLIERADRCLYQAKRMGKNRVCAELTEEKT